MINQLFTASIDSILIADANGVITQVNPAAEKMLGYSKDELLGQQAMFLYASEEEFNLVSSIIEATGKFIGEIVNKTKSGGEINTFLSANLLFDDEGSVIGMMGISRDITDNVLIQTKYEQLVNTVPDIIYSTDLEGYFTYVNETITRILGYDAKELIGTLFSNLIYKPHLEEVSLHYKTHFDKKLTQSYFEFQIIKKDGSLIWVGQQISTKFNSIDQTMIEGFYGVVRDINKQKKTELLLKESEEKYRELFDTSSDLIQSIDVNGKFLFVNESWIKTLGYTKKEIEQLDVFSLIHPDSKNHCAQLFKKIIETGENNEGRVLYSMLSKDGKKIMVEGAIALKKSNGQLVSLQSFLRDVTQQQEVEEKLIEREKALHQITETLSDVFYLYNIVENKYEYISSNCESVLGASKEFFYAGKSHTKEFGYKDDTEKLLNSKVKVDAGEAYDIDYRIVVDNEIRWINEKSFPIKNEEGKIISNSGICRDITDIKKANETIYKQNIEIGASILYAKRLQDAVLPSSLKLSEIFPDSFVLYKPKDVVSGDFYVVDYLTTNDRIEMPTFIVGDCTGHGIPGAVLSLMCNVLIRESFTRAEVNSPGDALDFVRDRLSNFFKTDNIVRIRDGMDVAFCVLNKEKNQLYFSGGYNSCVIVRGEKLLEYKGDKQHIGYTDNPIPFKNHTIDVNKGDLVFLYTDGFMDQFGGKNGRKYTKKRLQHLMLSLSDLSMKDIGKTLDNEFLTWKMEEEQTDDVTVLGIRIN